MLALKDKKILVLGVANERSIAHAVTTLLHEQGAKIALTYANEAFEKRVRPIAESLGITDIFLCDVQSDEHIDRLFAELKERWGTLNGLVHSVAYADREDLMGRFVDTSRSGFKLALDVSAYSLVALVQRAESLMKENGGSVVTMSYLGAHRVVSNYKVMGIAKAALEASVKYLASELGESQIRVNAVSAGPVRTLAASGIPQFKELYSQFESKAPLHRPIDVEEVAKSTLYLLSDLSSGVTGEVHYVDCGYNIIGT